MDKENIETRTRLLETAALVFAEHGFATATIRMIAVLARVNVAAVNYHFGSKDGLYREVLRHVRSLAYERYPTTYGLNAEAAPEESSSPMSVPFSCVPSARKVSLVSGC